MRALPVLWKTFAIAQSIGIVAMLVTGFYPRLEESPLTYIWAVLLLPGILVGKPFIGRLLPLPETPYAILIPATIMLIVLVNAACWLSFFIAARFVIRRRSGLTPM